MNWNGSYQLLLNFLFGMSGRYISPNCEAKHNNTSCPANLQLSRTIKAIVNLHSMTCSYA